jgi:tetratricopeptide (TPR) repeat protein
MLNRLLKAAVLAGSAGALLLILWSHPKSTGPSASKSPQSSAPATAAAMSVPGAGMDAAHEERMLTGALGKKSDHTPVLMRLAQLASGAGRHADAQRYLTQILEHEPGNVDARLELGRELFETGDVKGAIEQTGTILKANPNHTEALYNMGAIYGNLGNSRMALLHWNRLIATAPESESSSKARQMIALLPSGSR